MKKYKKIIIIVIILMLLLFGLFIAYYYYGTSSLKFRFASSFNTIINKTTEETDKLVAKKKAERKEKINKCLNTSLPESEISESISKKIDSLNNLFANDSSNFSYYYSDLNSGYSLSYNEKAENWAASIIKAPVAIYIYTLASKGEVDLEEQLTYTSGFYAEGTGRIRYQKVNTKYTIRTLVEYAIKYSDNIAHRMLVRHFGMDNIKEFWRTKGSTSIFENNQMFSNFNALDGYIVMKELYKFSTENEYGEELLSFFKAAKPNFVTGDEDDEIAHKYGWGQNALHDLTIIYDENPYILIVFTKKEQKTYAYFFKEVSSKVNEIHKEYNELKTNYCNSIE